MKSKIPIPLIVLGGFALIAIMPFLLVAVFFGVCFGLEKDIQDLFNSYGKD